MRSGEVHEFPGRSLNWKQAQASWQLIDKPGKKTKRKWTLLTISTLTWSSELNFVFNFKWTASTSSKFNYFDSHHIRRRKRFSRRTDRLLFRTERSRFDLNTNNRSWSMRIDLCSVNASFFVSLTENLELKLDLVCCFDHCLYQFRFGLFWTRNEKINNLLFLLKRLRK